MQPFAQTLSLLDALMPAHVIFSQVDNRPAGFSKIWLKDIIRDQLAFDGVLFSDDLSMAGAQAAGDVSARVKAAIEAGCDIALVCNDRVAAHEAAAAAQELPYPNQKRIKTMCGNIPKWQGDLESTCQQFDYWQQAKNNVTQIFFNVESDTQADKPANESKDPTDYK